MSFHKGFKTIVHGPFHGNIILQRGRTFKYEFILTLCFFTCQYEIGTFFGTYFWEMNKYPFYEKTRHSVSLVYDLSDLNIAFQKWVHPHLSVFLFDRDDFRQVPRFIYIDTFLKCRIICQQLKCCNG